MAAGGRSIVAMRASARWHASFWGKGESCDGCLVLVAAVAAMLALVRHRPVRTGAAPTTTCGRSGCRSTATTPSICGDDLGGFWGWAEFDRSADGTQTGDAEFAFCFHTVGVAG